MQKPLVSKSRSLTMDEYIAGKLVGYIPNSFNFDYLEGKRI